VEGDTVLCKAMLCTSDNAEEVVGLLLDRGARIDEGDELRRTPLMLALTFGIYDLVPILLTRGASMAMQGGSGSGTAFHLAVSEEAVDALELMALEDESRGEAAVNVPDQRGVTPLHLAVKLRCHAAVEVLLRHPAIAVDRADEAGQTPLMAAVLEDDHEAAGKLLEAGANPRVGAKSGLSAVFMTVMDREDQQMVRLLATAASGRHLSMQDERGNTMLHYAVMKHTPAIVRLLLSEGADRGTRNGEGLTPLQLASDYGFADIERLLRGEDDTENGLGTGKGEEQEEEEYGVEQSQGWGVEEDSGYIEAPPPDDDDMYDF
jgi:ankyrin repeat protein